MNETQSKIKCVAIGAFCIFTSPYLQLLLYQICGRFLPWVQPASGFLRPLLLLYTIPFFVGFFSTIYFYATSLTDLNKQTYYISTGELAFLGVMQMISILADYGALVPYRCYYTDQLSESSTYDAFLQVLNNSMMNGMSLPLLLMIKVSITPLFIQILSSLVLNRYFRWKSFFYFFLQIFGMGLHQYVVFENNLGSGTTQNPVYYYIYYPQLYVIDASKLYNPTFDSQSSQSSPYNNNSYSDRICDIFSATSLYWFYHWSPFAFVLLSSFMSALIIVYTKAYLVQRAYLVRMYTYQKQKLKLRDSQLVLSQLEPKTGLLPPRLISKQSMLYKRSIFLYGDTEKKPGKGLSFRTQRQKGLYRSRNLVRALQTPISSYPSYFSKVMIQPQLIFRDPFGQALQDYRREVILNTEEEESLEALQLVRDQHIGFKDSRIKSLSGWGYRLQDYCRKVEVQETEYKQMRLVLESLSKKIKKLNPLDEIANDSNYLMFHQHLFAEYNQAEATSLDLRFNSPVLDLLSMDYAHIQGLTLKHTFQMDCVTHTVMMFPLLNILQLLGTGIPETWTTFQITPWKAFLVDYTASDFQVTTQWAAIISIAIISILLILMRPISSHLALRNLSWQNQRQVQAASLFFTYILSFAFLEVTFQPPTMKLIGFSICIMTWATLISNVDQEMQNRQMAQTISLTKSWLAEDGGKRVKAQQVENQLVLIQDQLGDTIFRQAVQDALLIKNPKSLGFLAPSCLPARKLFDPLYDKVKVEWGGGYPRPQYEMLKSKWSAGPKKINVNPSTLSNITPDVNLAEIVSEKTKGNLTKQKKLQGELMQMEMRRRQLEMLKKMQFMALQKQMAPTKGATNLPPSVLQQQQLLFRQLQAAKMNGQQLTPQQQAYLIKAQSMPEISQIPKRNDQSQAVNETNKPQPNVNEQIKAKIKDMMQLQQHQKKYSQLFSEDLEQERLGTPVGSIKPKTKIPINKDLSKILSKVGSGEVGNNQVNILASKQRNDVYSVSGVFLGEQTQRPKAILVKTEAQPSKAKLALQQRLKQYAPLMQSLDESQLQTKDKEIRGVAPVSWIQAKALKKNNPRTPRAVKGKKKKQKINDPTKLVMKGKKDSNQQFL